MALARPSLEAMQSTPRWTGNLAGLTEPPTHHGHQESTKTDRGDDGVESEVAVAVHDWRSDFIVPTVAVRAYLYAFIHCRRLL
jgi:hypothetical protein